MCRDLIEIRDLRITVNVSRDVSVRLALRAEDGVGE